MENFESPFKKRKALDGSNLTILNPALPNCNPNLEIASAGNILGENLSENNNVKDWFSPYDQLPTEEDMGIETFLDKKRPKFIAYFKQRYSDFIVREISTKNEIIRLTDITTLPEFDRKLEEQQSQIYSEHQILTAFTDLIGSEDAQKLIQFSQSYPMNDENPAGDSVGYFISKTKDETLQITSKVAYDKTLRTKFHNLIRQYFPNLLDSETVINGETRFIKVFFKKSQNKQSTIHYWPREKPPYLRFVLYKENRETTGALDYLSIVAGIPSKIFSTAGTKDKRAVTTQYVTAHKLEARKLRNANHKLQGIQCGNFEYVTEPLKLGTLNGNQFIICLRGVSATDELIVESCEAVKKYGFINYFGSQRFGTGCIPTHVVGRYLLQADWSTAIDLILRPRGYEKSDATEARIYYSKTNDIDGTLSMLPRSHVIERILLNAIKKFDKSLNAFDQLPENVRLLYVHSYQSYIWNKLVTKRINLADSLENLVPILGDLVLDSEGKVIYITEENINQYNIFDIQMPLPGYNVKYPKNIIYSYLKELMGQDSLDPDDMKRKNFIISLPGGYRPIIRKPLDFEYNILRYSDISIPLTLTDLQEIQGELPVAPKEDNTGPAGKETAVLIKLKLDSATYATMVIREMTKNPTSQIYQRELQKIYDEKIGKQQNMVDETEDENIIVEEPEVKE